MVLSNKKLKQKLREALAQKAAAAAGAPITQTKTTTGRTKVRAKALPISSKGINGEASADIQVLLDSATKGRQSLSKREKRRKLRELSNGAEIKGAQNEATPIQTNKDQSFEDERNQQKRKLEKDEGTSVENKGIHLENGHHEGSESKKKKRKREDKDTQMEDKGTLMQEREDDKGTHLENGHVEGSESKKKKEGKKKGKDSQMKVEDTHLENGNVGVIKSKKKKKKKGKKKGKNKSEQGTSDDLALSSAAEAAEDIVINANEGTLPQSQESNYDECKVYVGGIPYYSNEDDIRSFFEGCGTVTEVDCMTFPDSGKFRGIALISFKTKAAATRALALDGADMGGRFLKIQQCRTHRSSKNDKPAGFVPTKVDKSNRAYIGNLAWDIAEDDLKVVFGDCKISAIRLGKDKTTGEFKGYGHIDFADEVSLAMALKLDQTVVCGRPIKIAYAIPKRDAETDDSAKTKSSTEKKKRRTCYHCGMPGHLSSSCPHNQSAENVDSKEGS